MQLVFSFTKTTYRRTATKRFEFRSVVDYFAVVYS